MHGCSSPLTNNITRFIYDSFFSRIQVNKYQIHQSFTPTYSLSQSSPLFAISPGVSVLLCSKSVCTRLRHRSSQKFSTELVTFRLTSRLSRIFSITSFVLFDNYGATEITSATASMSTACRTSWAIKTCRHILHYNCPVSWSTFISSCTLETRMNTVHQG